MATPSGDIDKQILERGYWIATHRIAIKRWIGVFLYVTIFIVYAVFFVQFGIYAYHLTEWDELATQAVTPILSWQQVHESKSPVNLVLSDPKIFPLGDDRYDIVVEVSNPNPQWAVESLSYQFTVNGTTKLPEQKSFVLPNDKKFFSILGYRSKEPVTSASIDYLKFRWKKVARLPNLSWIYTQQPTFSGRTIVMKDGQQIEVPARVTWTVRNGSTLNVRTVIWQIGLYSGDQLVSELEYKSEKFEFYQERPFEVYINGNIPRVDSVKVFPIVDIFSSDAFYLPTDNLK